MGIKSAQYDVFIGKKAKSAGTQGGGGGGVWLVVALVVVVLGVGGIGLYSYNQHQEQLRLEKSTIEEVEQECLEKNVVEKANQQIKNENYLLYTRIKNKKNRIELADYDRGQSFGKYLDDLITNFEAAELAREEENPKPANEYYKAAEKAADWLIANALLREEVRELQQQVAQQKKAADEFSAEKFSQVVYREALSKVEQSYKEYEICNFAKAKELLQSALSGYQKAYEESCASTLKHFVELAEEACKNKQWDKVMEVAEKIRPLDEWKANELVTLGNEQIKSEKINKELAAARRAKSKEEWQNVHDHAVVVLQIDSFNVEAQNLKRDAENYLIPTLNIYAYVDGKIVSATIKSLKTVPDWKTDPWKLEKGSEYEFEVTYKSGDDEYYGKIPAFICTANGPHRKEVVLEKVDFPNTIDLPNGIKLKMVKIKAGSFIMGSPEEEKGHSLREKQHCVTLTKDYWIGQYEVTQAQYKVIMGENPSYFKGSNRPVERVSWLGAKTFCEKLNEQYAGKLPQGYQFDLPTEAQWEYACRAGTTTAFSYGNDSNVKKMNFRGTSPYGDGEIGIYRKETVNVGSLGYKNAWGLYDMHGNVCEWCRDRYGDYPDDVTDPVGPGPSGGSYRVARGGSWYFIATYCRSACRKIYFQTYPYYYLGFRLALVPVQ